jgi:steroid delta-isomerase-like uncharacterized protein
MRKVSFGLAVGFVLVACGGGENEPPKTPATPAPTMTTAPSTMASAEPPKEEPKKASFAEMQTKTMMGFTEALNARDAKKLSSFYTPNAVQKVAGAPSDMTGPEQIQAGYQKLFDAFKDFKSAGNRIFKKDDVVIVEWAFTGTHTGDLWGMKATEKPVGANGVDLFWFDKDSGLIKEHHIYYDGATILSQIGVSKQKARPIPTLSSSMPTPIESKSTPEETKNLDTSKAMIGAMESKKEADFLAPLADTVEYDDYTMPQTMKGKADAKKFFKEMTTAFPDTKFNVLNSWAFGDFVVVESHMTGTNKGAFMGMPATKKTVSMNAVDVYQFKDGKIVHGWSYSNGAEFAQQMGLMPTPKKADDKAAKPGDKPADKGATPAKPATPSDKDATPAKPATPATPAKPADKK